MQTVGFCTHFSQTCEWAFEYALNLSRSRGCTLAICHWLDSPFKIRRDEVYAGPNRKEIVHVTEDLLVQRERELREYYDPKLGDFLDVKFKLCEGHYQVELIKCLRRHEIDLVVMGYREPSPTEGSQEDFARSLKYPVVIVGPEGPDSYLINQKALEIIDDLELPEGKWAVLNGHQTTL